MPTYKTLGFFTGVAVVTSIGTYYMKFLLEQKIASSEVCKKSVDMLHCHQLAMSCLGPPVNVGRPSMFDKFIAINASEANIALPVKGTKSKGQLLISVSKDDNETWSWKYLKFVPKEGNELIILGKEST